AGVPAHHLGRHRGSDRLRDQRRHGHVLGRRALGFGADPEGPRFTDAAAQRQGRELTPWQQLAAACWVGVVLLLVLSPHIGILLMSLSRVWSFSVLPEGFTLAHYATVFTQSKGMIVNTLVY